MKYYNLYNKEQETKGDLLADLFGSILGMGLYTSVVNPLPKMITNTISRKKLEPMVRFIFKKPTDVVIKFDHTVHKSCMS